MTPNRVIGSRCSRALNVWPSCSNSSSRRLRRVGVPERPEDLVHVPPLYVTGWSPTPRSPAEILETMTETAPFTSELAAALAPDLLDRFLRYVRIDTQSQREALGHAEHARPARARRAAGRRTPAGRADGCNRRRTRLRDGDARPTNGADGPVIGLLAHIDTSPDAPGPASSARPSRVRRRRDRATS